MNILAMDTANKAMTVGLIRDGELLAEKTLHTHKMHSQTLMPSIEELFRACQCSLNEIDRIVCVNGPGSYTGVRIAVTTAKTLAYALSCELVGVSSLEVLAKNRDDFEGLIASVIDARRKNVYAALYRCQRGQLETVLQEGHYSFSDFLQKCVHFEEPILFIGETENFKDEIAQLPNAIRNENKLLDLPHAYRVAQIGANHAAISNVHDFVPNYLKNVEAVEKWLERSGIKESEESDYVEKM